MRRRALRITLAAAQWVLLTSALAAVIVRASSATSGLVMLHLDGSWIPIAAFLTALLIGITIESPRILGLLVIVMWLVAAGAIALLTMLPVWEEIIPGTSAITNYAINQLVVLPLVTSLPGAFGALCGNLLRRLLAGWQEILPPEDAQQSTPGWWDR